MSEGNVTCCLWTSVSRPVQAGAADQLTRLPGKTTPIDVLRLKAVSVGVVVIKGEITGRGYGQPKAGPATHQGQKAIFFLPRPAGNM
ncbi:hypothetical protein KUCAC02_002825 [Chaenocephalus aceratus]|uniref:Uncharacterized protein n=1 Tax=Chaenocephalus aceratus TaxID=36190 RepID=A0ACB9WJF3_CHAAC|nr:hypothetical protein KUCAC02_002825 [Chaenocephalus aceratus]